MSEKFAGLRRITLKEKLIAKIDERVSAKKLPDSKVEQKKKIKK